MIEIAKIEKDTDCCIEYHTQIASTNERAKEIAQKVCEKQEKGEFPENVPNVIFADYQVAGKGTQGRVWDSEPEANILLSMLVFPKNTMEEMKHITYQIAQMVQAAIQDLYGISLEIKEPNDLLLHGKKICGILTESKVQANKINYLVIGIGFNVNQVAFPEKLAEIATSLKREYPEREFQREEIIIRMLRNGFSLFRK